jgi:hypothetical protein
MVLLNFALLALFTCSYLSRYHPERVKTQQEALEQQENAGNRSLLSAQYVSSSTPATVIVQPQV